MATHPDNCAYPTQGGAGGLTKRELMAMKNMEALLKNAKYFDLNPSEITQIANQAVLAADALIVSLNENK